MGSAISKAVSGVGNAIGNAFAEPFKSIFGGTCEDFCAGSWDVICFIEHLCVVNLLKLFMICCLSYITLLFLYLLLKLGVFQCIGRSLCRMCWTACETYWSTIGHVSCFMWHKLINTRRVYRGRRQHKQFQDVDGRYSAKDKHDYSNSYLGSDRKRKLVDDAKESPQCLHRHRNSRHHHRHHHRGQCHPSNLNLGTRQVSMDLRRSSRRTRSLQDHRHHHRHHHHPETLGDVERGGSFKRQRIERL